MSNVITLANTVSSDSQVGRMHLLNSLHEQGCFYDVLETENLYPVTLSSGEKVFQPTGKKTLVNGDTMKPISVMSDGYTVVQNKDIFKALDREIASSGLDLTDAYTKVQVANDGAQVLVRYVFPAHTISTSNGDETALSIVAINSFNGTTSFAIYVGGFRFACANGQIFGTTIVSYKKQHSRSLSITAAASVIKSGIEAFEKEGELWKVMGKVTVNDQKAYTALADLADIDTTRYPTYEVYMKEYVPMQQRITKLQNYMRIWEDYKQSVGANEFGLYNTFTHISTHGAAASGNREQSPSTFDTRQKTMVKVCNNHLTAYAKAA